MLVPSSGQAGSQLPQEVVQVPAATPKSAMLERRTEVVVERMALPSGERPVPMAPPMAYGPIATASRSPVRQGPQGVHPNTAEVRELRSELEQLAQEYGALHEHANSIHLEHQDYVRRMERAVDEFRDEGNLYLLREASAHANIAAQARAEALQHGETLQTQ